MHTCEWNIKIYGIQNKIVKTKDAEYAVVTSWVLLLLAHRSFSAEECNDCKRVVGCQQVCLCLVEGANGRSGKFIGMRPGGPSQGAVVF